MSIIPDRRTGLALALIAMGAAGCAPSPRLPSLASSDAALLAEARADYRAACAPCHGLDARGGGPVGASLRTPPADLTRLTARHGGAFPFDDVVATIAGERAIGAHGTRDMPVWSQRFGSADGATAVATIHARRRLEMLASYLATLQRPQNP